MSILMSLGRENNLLTPVGMNLLSYVAALTQSAKLGTSVLIPSTRNPVMLAKETAYPMCCLSCPHVPATHQPAWEKTSPFSSKTDLACSSASSTYGQPRYQPAWEKTSHISR